MEKFFFQIFLFFYLSFFLGLSAQYSSFELHSGSSFGLAGLGVGLQDRETALGSNPAFLASTDGQIQIGTLFVQKETSPSPMLLHPFAFYSSLSLYSGWGMRIKTGFLGQFEATTKLTHYESEIFYCIKLENFYFSVGVGPRIAFRGREQSKWSLGGFLGIGYFKNNWSFGIFGSSSGKFSYEEYRGSDTLEEKLPEYIFLGTSFKFLERWLTYLEVGRIFYEKSFFRLSNSESKPNLDRGIGADVDINFGIEYSWTTYLKLRSGFGLAGKFNNEGQNQRGGAISLGVKFFLFEENKFFIVLSTLNHSILSKSGKILPENYYFLSGGYLW